jgi:hypothetical protein
MCRYQSEVALNHMQLEIPFNYHVCDTKSPNDNSCILVGSWHVQIPQPTNYLGGVFGMTNFFPSVQAHVRNELGTVHVVILSALE